MNYDLEKYQKLKQLIETGEIEKFLQLIDSEIVRNSDLKDLIINYYIDADYLVNKEKLDKLIDKLVIFTGEEYLLQNKKFISKYLQNQINSGFFFDEEIHISAPEQKEQLLQLFMENIKNPFFEIMYIPHELSQDEKFINYCLKNKNLSILNYIEYKEKYLNKAIELVEEGYGFNMIYSLKEEYKKELVESTIKNGYINNISFINIKDTEKFEELLPIVKKYIKNGKKFIEDQFYIYNLSTLLKDQELVDLLIETNQLTSYIMNNVDFEKNPQYLEKTIQKIKAGTIIDRPIFNIESPALMRVLLETNQLNQMNNANKEAFNKNIDLFKEKLKEGQLFSLNNYKCDMWLKKINLDFELLKILSTNNIENLLILMKYINHHDELINLYNEEFYQSTRTILAKYYNLNLEHLDQFIEKIGTQYLYYIENDNIKNAINLSKEDFEKYLSLFMLEPLNLNDVQNIYDSILQYRFKSENESDVNRLTNIKDSLTNQNYPFPLEDLKVLAKSLNIKEFQKLQILTNEELIQLDQNILQYLIDICNKVKNNQDIERNLTILFEINRCHLRKKREIYRSEHNYENELKLESKYEEKSLISALISDLAKSIEKTEPRFRTLYYTINEEFFSYHYFREIVFRYDLIKIFPLAKLIENNDPLLEQCLLFIKTKGQMYNTKETKQTLKQLKEILRYIINNEEIFNELKHNIQLNNYKIKKVYQIPKDNFKVFSILQEINPYELRDTVFNKPEIYESLKQHLKKYKFTNWQDIFQNALYKSNLTLESYDIAAMITKFNELYKYINKNQNENNEVKLPDIIKYANVLASASDRYKILLGEEDCKILRLNPGPNAATITGNRICRLDEAISNLINLYKRKELTTPPLNENIIINNKQINVNLGNYTNPINLTYGERTGSCMRIMGVGETLYNFCQTNENAFHIRLTDPQTGKFISRVSGYRNGNSIFLNQLRESKEPEIFNNSDVIAAIKEVSKILIERSKDSSLRIDNIFITGEYAMSLDSTSKKVNITENIKEGLPYFYFDLRGSGIVLATNSKDNDYVPINTDKSNLPKYQVLRDTPKEYEKTEEIAEQINKIHLLNQIISKNDPSLFTTCALIPNEKTESIIYLLSGEDWIAYLDNELQIYTDYIQRNDDRTFYELNNAVEILKQKKEEYQYNETTNRSNNRI